MRSLRFLPVRIAPTHLLVGRVKKHARNSSLDSSFPLNLEAFWIVSRVRTWDRIPSCRFASCGWSRSLENGSCKTWLAASNCNKNVGYASRDLQMVSCYKMQNRNPQHQIGCTWSRLCGSIWGFPCRLQWAKTKLREQKKKSSWKDSAQ